MTRLNLKEDIKPLTEFRANVAAFVQKVRKSKRPMVITQHGKSSAVLLGVEEYESLIEKLELLQEIHLAEKQIGEHKAIDHQAVKHKITKIIKK